MGKTRYLKRSAIGAAALTAMTVAALWASAFAGASHVNPELFDGNGNKSCGQLAGTGQSWTELKIDPNADGTFSDGTLSVTVVHTSPDKVFNWTANLGVDAVFVKAGSVGSYLYRYDPPNEETSDTGLTSPGSGNSISHISFCYDKDPKGSLTVIKHVSNDDGGSASASNWTMNVSGPTPLSFPGAEAPGTTNTVKAGSYTVTESGGSSGYALSYSGDCDANGNVTVGDGESKTCTLTNDDQPATLIVKKVVVNDHGGQASADDFGFSVNGGDVQPFEEDGQNELQVDAGTYNVTEPAADGYATSYENCSNLQIPPGGSATCTVTNNDVPGTLIVKKEMVGGTDTFDFTGTPSGSIAQSGGTISAIAAPGQYTSTEVAKAGWTLTSVSCDDANSSGNVATRTATFRVAAGETVTCTFTNSVHGKIVVEKQTSPDGDTQLFGFDASYDANGFSLADGQQDDSGPLAPGTYSVSENVPAGWDLASAVCSDGSPAGAIALGLGETVTCAFTNEKDAAIVVEKQTDPDGHAQVFQFSASYDANGFSLADGQQDNSGDLAPGTYSVSENVPAGWDLASAVCSDQSPANAIALAAGETVTCVFTNTLKRGAIIVEKQTLPDGDTQVFDFSASYDQDGFSLSDGQSNDSGTLLPGTYSVSEAVPAGWELESAVCSDGSPVNAIVLGADETVRCTFTNEKDANIVVQKQTLPDADPQVFHFDASYDESGFDLSDGQSADSGDLDPGTYSVSEDVPAGWALTSAVCSDQSAPAAISLTAGETVTCVFTNTKRGTIVVEKQTAPDGASGQFSFSGDASGSIGDNGQIVVPNLLPGTYTSTEAAAAGWNLTSIACSDANSTGALGTRTATFVLEAGETVKCTFTNGKQLQSGQGAIDVQKSADPTTIEEPGGPVTFSVTVTNVSSAKVALENVVDNVFGDLDDDGGSGCFDVPVNLAPGEKVNCTFVRPVTGPGGSVHVNTVKAEGHDEFGNAVSDTDDARVEITPRLIDLVIVKDATSPTPLNGIVNYTLTVTNKGPNDATNVQVADPAPAGILYLTASPTQGTCAVTSALITCSLGTIKKGEAVVIRVTARATTVGTHTNTATVTGAGGRETNPADNVDSAVTVVPAPIRPPVAKPKRKPQPEFCLTLTVSPKMIKADGRPDRVIVKVTAGNKRVRGTKVVISGAGIRQSARSDARGIATMRVNPRKAGLVTITAIETNQRVCGPKRIGVVGVFLPPLTG